MARPRYQPTMADRNTVKVMAAAGIIQEDMCRCIGEYGIDLKTLRKHFRKEIDTGKTLMVANATSAIAKAINAGEAWAVCFYLKCRAGWQETQAHRFVDANDKDRPLTIADIDAIVEQSKSE